MKFYDFLERKPPIGKLVVIEGEERLLSEMALETLVERLVPPETRTLNVERFDASELADFKRVEEAVGALPFLADSRVVIVRGAHQLRAAARRALWAIVDSVPEGNTLVLEDLVPATRKVPEPFGKMAGRRALRIDTNANADARARFIEEFLAAAGLAAEKRVVAELAHHESSDLSAVRNDLEKLALLGRRITLADLAAETLADGDPKAYLFAGALAEGRVAEALAMALELLADDPRAGVPLASAAALEFLYVWDLSRPGGELPPHLRWREHALRRTATRLGARRARLGFERAVRAFEAIVTGKIDDHRTAIELLVAQAAPARAAAPLP